MSYFKFWCKKNYRLEKIGSLNVVYCVKTSCPVVAKESMFETLVKCHERVGHSGRRKTWDEVKKNYAGIRFDVTNWQASKKVHDVCQCKGSCITNRCCCKKRGIKCSTKCHINSMACQNKI